MVNQKRDNYDNPTIDSRRLIKLYKQGHVSTGRERGDYKVLGPGDCRLENVLGPNIPVRSRSGTDVFLGLRMGSLGRVRDST